MQKLFVANEGHEKIFTRNGAKGHKRLVVSDDVEIVKPIKLYTDGTDLVVVRNENTEGAEVYTMLCQEFGLVGGVTKFKNKISVIFCDNGWMLVTLLHGALVMNLEDQLMMPTAGDDFATPKVVKEDICWVNADNLLEYGKYFGVQGRFMYDVEWVFEISGDNISGMRSFSIRNIQEENIDISLGYIAQYEQQLQLKEEAKEARNLARNILKTGSDTEYEFDDDDYEDDEDDEDSEDGEMSFEDFGM